VDSWQPQWRTGLDQLLGTFRAVSADSLVTARKIRQPIESEADIDGAFDSITYSKGAAVLKMFESGIGPEVFRKAIRSYLKEHAWSSASTADFLASLNNAAGQDVGAAFSTFLEQSGAPLVSAQVDGSSGQSTTLKLSQKRYLPVGSSGDIHRTWGIPLRMRFQSGEKSMRFALSFSNQQQTISLKTEPSGLKWLLLNADAAGYFVGAYHGELLNQLLHAGTGKLSSAERMSVAHSISAAVRSADLPLGQALSLEPALLLDPERRVVTMAAEFMDVREKVPPELSPNYQRYIRKHLEPLLGDSSWQSKKNETDDEHLQRLTLLSLAADSGEDRRLIDDAKRLALAWLENHNSVPPDEADVVLPVAGRYADASLVEKLLAATKKTKEASDKQPLLSALGSCKDAELAKRVLDAVAAREFKPVDSIRLLQRLSSHIETRALTYDYLKEYYAAITAAIPSDSAFSYLPNLARGFDTPERRSDVEAFFKDKDDKLTGGPRIIAQVSESIHLNQAFKEAQLPSLIEFLKSQ
jgi:alanyl aminopeptidase